MEQHSGDFLKRDLSGSSSQQRAAGYAEKRWPPAFRRGRHHLTLAGELAANEKAYAADVPGATHRATKLDW